MSTLALTSNTLAGTPAAGQIEYNGQFYATDSNASRAQVERLVQGTSVASTSGTSITFTGIPAWAKKITVMFSGVSTSGTSIVQLQAGLTTPETTGYVSSVAGTNTTAIANAAFTSGFGLETSALASATTARQGVVILTNVSGNTWTAIGNISSSTPQMAMLAGSKTFSGVIDRVVITTVNGTDTFDAGSINIMYEG